MASAGLGAAVLDLGSAGNFTVLSKTGITDVFKTSVVGNVGTSPITGAALLLTSAEVTGYIYTVDAAGPLPCWVTDATRLTPAVGDMEAAYNDAAGRVNPDVVNLVAGEIGGLTLTPGLYKWGTDVNISNDVTLTGGAQAKNVFWQTAGVIGTQAHFEGVVLSKTMIAMKTRSSINGSLLAQTAVTLQMNSVVQPACKSAQALWSRSPLPALMEGTHADPSAITRRSGGVTRLHALIGEHTPVEWADLEQSVPPHASFREGPHLRDRPSESGSRQQNCSDPQMAVVVNHQDRPG